MSIPHTHATARGSQEHQRIKVTRPLKSLSGRVSTPPILLTTTAVKTQQSSHLENSLRTKTSSEMPTTNYCQLSQMRMFTTGSFQSLISTHTHTHTHISCFGQGISLYV